MADRTCPICHEGLSAPPDVIVHPSCKREHPEFDLSAYEKIKIEAPREVAVTKSKMRDSGTATYEELVELINKQFGEGAMRKGTDVKPIAYRRSGSYALDLALGGGWPKGRVIDVLGKEGHGKTLVVELAIIAAQRYENLRSVIFDLEGTWDKQRFVALGGDLKMLDVVTAANVEDRNMPLLFGETAFDMAKLILRYSNTHAIVAFDSTGAMVSKAEYEAKEETMEKATMTHTARLMSEGLRIVVGSGLLARSANLMNMFFISQSRDNIGARAVRGLPPPDKATGGRALRFYGSVRIEVSKGETYKGDVEDEVSGRKETNVEVAHVTKVRVRKNKCNHFQGRVAEFNLYTEGDVKGIDPVDELFKLAQYCNVIRRGGKFYNLPDGIPRVEGKDAMLELLRTDQVVFDLIEHATQKQLAVMMDNTAQPETEEEALAIEADDEPAEPVTEFET